MKNSNGSIKLEYLYRDAGNYKLYEQVIFANPEGLSLNYIDREIRSKLIDSEFFYPMRWGLKKPDFPTFSLDLDHDLCEYLNVNYSNRDPTSSSTILKFLNTIEKSIAF